MPDTPAGEQLSWVMDALAEDASDLTDQDYAAHFSELFQEELTREQGRAGRPAECARA